MISINVMGDWHTLDTLNGYYRLEDLFKAVGSPEGKEPIVFANERGPHAAYTIQRKKYVWANQDKVYGYAAFLDPKFDEIMQEVLETGDLALARTIATGVQHK